MNNFRNIYDSIIAGVEVAPSTDPEELEKKTVEDELIMMKCPNCGTHLEKFKSLLDKDKECPICGTDMKRKPKNESVNEARLVFKDSLDPEAVQHISTQIRRILGRDTGIKDYKSKGGGTIIALQSPDIDRIWNPFDEVWGEKTRQLSRLAKDFGGKISKHRDIGGMAKSLTVKGAKTLAKAAAKATKAGISIASKGVKSVATKVAKAISDKGEVQCPYCDGWSKPSKEDQKLHQCPKCYNKFGIGGKGPEVKPAVSEKKTSRGKAVFKAGSPKVNDDKDHFPINSADQARNALARVAQYKSAPKWYEGSLADVQKKVRSAVKKAYPSIEVSEAKEDVDSIEEKNSGASGVSEQLEQKLKVIASGIEDKMDAETIARTKKGRVIPDENDEKKFAVVVDESKIEEAIDSDMFQAKVPLNLDIIDAGSKGIEYDVLTEEIEVEYKINTSTATWGIDDYSILFLGDPVEVNYKDEDGEHSLNVDLSDASVIWEEGTQIVPTLVEIRVEGGKVVEKTVFMSFIKK